jgi:uncharacterized protein involved in oxidation of intracellular sulfur
MGEAVECEGLTHEKYNVDEQLKAFVNVGGENLEILNQCYLSV